MPLLACKTLESVRGTPLRKLSFHARPCEAPLRRLLGTVVGPLLMTAGVVALAGTAVFQHRAEIAYLWHLVRVRHGAGRADAPDRRICYDAFVCYSGKNRKWVMRRLASLLESRPQCYALCLFDRDFRMGSQIVSNIVDAIDHSRKVIVVLTQKFIDSKWCQWEMEMAQHKLFSEDSEFLVLLELESLERRRLPRLLRFLLGTRPVVRWPRLETMSAVLAAAAQLRRALGPSLRQRPPHKSSPLDEPVPTSTTSV